MKKTFTFGKIRANFAGRKENLVTVIVELRKCGGEKTPEYTVFSTFASIWNRTRTRVLCGGQCLDFINEHRDELSDSETWDTIYRLWEKYHLNGMHAGTPEQEKAVNEWLSLGHKYDYTAACDMLKDCGLYEIPFYGITIGKRYNGEMYKYGHGWVVHEIPADDLKKIEELLKG